MKLSCKTKSLSLYKQKWVNFITSMTNNKFMILQRTNSGPNHLVNVTLWYLHNVAQPKQRSLAFTA